MLNQVEQRLMADFVPISKTGLLGNVSNIAQTRGVTDYTSKDGGQEFYQKQDKEYKPDPDKPYFDQLKQIYRNTTELQLRFTESIRNQIKEYGPEMLLLMIEYS